MNKPSDLIKLAIERKGMTQKEAAAILEISQSHLSDICTSKRSVSAYVAVRLQKHFGVNAQVLLFQQATAEIVAAWEQMKEEGQL